MKLAVVGYAPPPKFKGATSFMENLRQNKTANELILFSDYPYPERTIPVLNPENVTGRDRNPQWAVNNTIFVSALRIALMSGVSHMLYIESDCRFGCHGWDSLIFEEYFSLPFPPIAAGSLVSHACVNGGPAFYQRFHDMIAANRENKKEWLIPIYGVPVTKDKKSNWPPMSAHIIDPGHKDDRFKPAVYPNGALGIYDVRWIAGLFGLLPDGTFQTTHSLIDISLSPAWDHLIGLRLYDKFGSDVFDVVAHMNGMFSSYGETMSTEAQRLEYLRTKRCVAVHQIKSEVVQ